MSILQDCIAYHQNDAVAYLIQSGANLNIRTGTDGNTPLMTAIEERNIVAIDLLLRAPVLLKLTNYRGQTALDKAREWNDKATEGKIIEALVGAAISPLLFDFTYGRTGPAERDPRTMKTKKNSLLQD